MQKAKADFIRFAGDLVREYPVAVALAGLAAGAVVAAALPASSPERRVFAPAGKRRYEPAETASQKTSEAAAAADERLNGGVTQRDAIGELKELPDKLASGIAGEQKSGALSADPVHACAAGSDADQFKSDSTLEGEQEFEEAKTAKAILDARQKAVDDIRAGRPAPYYFTVPASTVSADTSALGANETDAENEVE